MKASKGRECNGLLSLIDEVFVVSGEMVASKGEDSFSHSINERYGFLGVFDGCGGIGSRTYTNLGNKTGAYIASRITSNMAYEWFLDFCNKNLCLSDNTIQSIVADMRGFLLENLSIADSESGSSNIKGSLAKSFPTTGAIILCEYRSRLLQTYFVWAGDSRGYLLTEDGLTQVTTDDIEGGMDAMCNLSSDGRLTNVISAAGDFTLNHRGIALQEPALLITATDGCFSYFASPMEFEYMLLKTLSRSKNTSDWQKALDRNIREFAGDDYTMCIAICGYEAFGELKKAFTRRRISLWEEYIAPIKTADQAKLLTLWERYKGTYYGGLNEGDY